MVVTWRAPEGDGSGTLGIRITRMIV